MITKSMFFKWLALWPIDFAASSLARILAPFVALLAKDNHLPAAFRWMETHDNDLSGDGGWKKEHWQWRFKFPEKVATYLGHVGWLWRNSAYQFNIDHIAVKIAANTPMQIEGDIRVSDRPGVAGTLTIKIGEAWEFYRIIPYRIPIINIKKCIRLRFGWKLKGYAEATLRGESQDETAMYVMYVNPLKFYGGELRRATEGAAK